MKRYAILLFVYILFMAVGTTMSASTTYPAPDGAQPTKAQITTDSLPMGRHQVSSYRNGSSTEFMVEDGEIKSLVIDGKTIPESEYPQYQHQVEDMLGGRYTTGDGNHDFNVFRELHNLEGDAERIEEYFERNGERWERIGEEIAEKVERMFEFDRDGSNFRFYFDGEDGDVMEFNLDSIRQFHDFDNHDFDFEDLTEEKDRQIQSAEEEVKELETMIERMERRKAAAEQRVEEEKSTKSLSYNGFSFERALKELRVEGLIDPGVIRSFEFTAKGLRVNGKPASEAAHQRMLEEYRQKVNVGKKFSISLDELNW